MEIISSDYQMMLWHEAIRERQAAAREMNRAFSEAADQIMETLGWIQRRKVVGRMKLRIEGEEGE